MGWLLASVTGVIPEGPLHPALAASGLVAGVSAAAVAGRHAGRWLALMTLVGVGLVTVHQGDVLRRGMTDRPDRLTVLGVVLAVVALGAWARPRWSTATLAALCACAGVWAVVPDTEVPLLAGAVLCGGATLRLLPGWLPDTRRRSNAALLVWPLAAAAAGSIGRPERFAPSLLLAGVVAGLGLAAWVALNAGWRRQRAGTPTTVAPAATSSTTTAPAPTIAS